MKCDRTDRMLRGLSSEVLGRVLGLYDIADWECLEVRAGYRNVSHRVATPSGELNVMLFKNEAGIIARINQVDALAEHVHRLGLPVRTRYDARLVRLHGRSERYVGIYHYLPGETISWEAYTMKHIKVLGWALAEFHRSARSYDADLPSVVDEYRSIVGRMARYFARSIVQKAFEEKCGLVITPELTSFLELLDRCAALPGAQPLHMDFVRGNLLFGGAENASFRIGDVMLSGIIDLEKAAIGPVIVDIARTLAFLYVDAPKPADKVYKYFIRSGYRKRGGGCIDTASMACLDGLVTMMLSYDLYKFLRDNPYESLVYNYHFCRTRDMLIERKVLQYTH